MMLFYSYAKISRYRVSIYLTFCFYLIKNLAPFFYFLYSNCQYICRPIIFLFINLFDVLASYQTNVILFDVFFSFHLMCNFSELEFSQSVCSLLYLKQIINSLNCLKLFYYLCHF